MGTTRCHRSGTAIRRDGRLPERLIFAMLARGEDAFDPAVPLSGSGLAARSFAADNHHYTRDSAMAVRSSGG